jgi:hypothetical protein
MELFVLSFLWSNGSIMLQLDGTGPLHQQIYRAFRNEILSGGLAPGERVPSTRTLADLLKVSRNTAVSAYEQLLAEGYLETRLGAAGTVVAPVLPPERLALRPSAPPGLQGRPSRRAGVRLAIAGERILKTARAGARPCGVRRSAVCALVQAARLARPQCQPAGSRLRPAAGPLGDQRGHRHSPPTPAWG